MAVVFGEIGEQVPKEFLDDREKLSGRPFDLQAMKAAAGPMKAQWRAQASWIEHGLGGHHYLGGSTPSLADIAAYMNVWWLGRAAAGVAAMLLSGMPKTLAWRDRMAELGHGKRTEMTSGEALNIAMTVSPGPAPPSDPAEHFKPGADVVVRADDYGRDPVSGSLVSISADRIVVSRDCGELNLIQVHFPRVGYVLSAA